MEEKEKQKTTETEDSIFDAAEESENMPAGDVSPDVAEEEEEKAWEAKTIDESPAARKERLGERKEMDGEIVTIKSIFFTRPKTRKPDGEPIAPKKTIGEDKEFYSAKLGVKFEEDNLVEYYPNFKYFVNDGKLSNTAKIYREGKNAVNKLFQLAVVKMGKPADEISDQEFYDWLVGKKVKLEIEKGIYLKQPWFRNNIIEFVE